MRDNFNKIHPLRCISPVSVADNTAQVGQIIDRQGFESLTYVIAMGSLADADATFAVLLEHGDAANLSDATAATGDNVLGTAALAGFIFSDDDKTRKIGYVGGKRYTRLTITPANNTSAAVLAAVAILGGANKAPTVNPPV